MIFHKPARPYEFIRDIFPIAKRFVKWRRANCLCCLECCCAEDKYSTVLSLDLDPADVAVLKAEGISNDLIMNAGNDENLRADLADVNVAPDVVEAVVAAAREYRERIRAKAHQSYSDSALTETDEGDGLTVVTSVASPESKKQLALNTTANTNLSMSIASMSGDSGSSSSSSSARHFPGFSSDGGGGGSSSSSSYSEQQAELSLDVSMDDASVDMSLDEYEASNDSGGGGNNNNASVSVMDFDEFNASGVHNMDGASTDDGGLAHGEVVGRTRQLCWTWEKRWDARKGKERIEEKEDSVDMYTRLHRRIMRW